jgi:hypothetical protein
MKYKVTTIATGEVDVCDSMEQVNDHIDSQIRWFNSPEENEAGRGYTKDDFKVEEVDESILWVGTEHGRDCDGMPAGDTKWWFADEKSAMQWEESMSYWSDGLIYKVEEPKIQTR